MVPEEFARMIFDIMGHTHEEQRRLANYVIKIWPNLLSKMNKWKYE